MPAADDERLEMARAVLGARLRQLRLQQGRHLAEVAAAAGLATSYLSELERGHKVPTLPVLLALADAYDVLVTEVLTDLYPFGSRHRPRRPPTISDGRRAR
ncbi:helix-turn-helix domain-containing protein [Geodermatophilus sp. SYSU D00700]